MTVSDFFASTILKVEASFGFSEFACDPDEISRQLGISPDETQTKGEERAVGGGHHIRAFSNAWHIASTTGSKDVNDHLRELLARLEGSQRLFDPAWGQPSFAVLWKGTYLYAGSGPFYEADVIAGIAALGAELYQDICQVDQDEENES